MIWTNTPSKDLPSHYCLWLTKAQRLSHHFEHQGAKITLKILNMSVRELRPHERQALNISTIDTKGYVREIVLIDEKKGITLSHARVSVNPSDQETIALFNTLGARLIGENLLHHDAHIKRGSFRFAEAEADDAQHVLPPKVSSSTPSFAFAPWSRYSVFSRDAQSWLVITETLAPLLASWDI